MPRAGADRAVRAAPPHHIEWSQIAGSRDPEAADRDHSKRGPGAACGSVRGDLRRQRRHERVVEVERADLGGAAG